MGPVFVFMDEYDTEYVPHMQRKAYKRLEDAGATVTIHLERKCDHYMPGKAELYWCAKWIALCSTGQDLSVPYRDADHLPDDAMALRDDIETIMADVPRYHMNQSKEEGEDEDASKDTSKDTSSDTSKDTAKDASKGFCRTC